MVENYVVVEAAVGDPSLDVRHIPSALFRQPGRVSDHSYRDDCYYPVRCVRQCSVSILEKMAVKITTYRLLLL